MRTHYRSTVLFSEPAIEEAGVGLEGFYRLFKRYERITGQSFYELDAPRNRQAGGELVGETASCREKFLAAMDDDFNTGGAIGELFELAKITNKYCDKADLEGKGKSDKAALAKLEQLLTTLKELTMILGLFGEPASASGSGDELLGQTMQLVIDLRTEARANKNFATADAIRDGIGPLGITLEDRAGGTEWSGGAEATLGGGEGTLDGIMGLLIELRKTARANKDFATSDTIRDRLSTIGVTLEDRTGGTEWSQS